MKQKKLHGFIAWQGPSELDGKPVALVVVRGSKNKKTGALIQTYILRTDISPVEATRTGDDFSICGDCKHRKVDESASDGRGAGTCYVRVENGPLIVWKGIQLNRYPHISQGQAQDELSGESVRLGAYGDPAAVPFGVWANILAHAADWTGYTHQWKRAESQQLKRYCMASCDTLAESIGAQSAGWRTFTVLPKNYTETPSKSFLCPASEEAGKKLHCLECMACSGTGQGRTANVFIPVHGVAFKQARFSNLITIGRN